MNILNFIIRIPRRILMLIVRLYQKTLSLDHGWLGKVFPNNRVCIFSPSCSQYSYEALDRFGVFKGGWLSIKRFVRCAPWGKGGYDPVRIRE